jgi:flagellar biosynthesis chaperone FliJ
VVSWTETIKQEHEKLEKLMLNIRSCEIKLAEASRQVSDWRTLETLHANELNDAKKSAREISDKLFGENIGTLTGCPTK